MSDRKFLHFGFPVGVVVLMLGVVVSVAMLASAPKVAAQSSVCHAAMVLDRSGSVGNTNETTLKNQILRLFQPPKWSPQTPTGGLYDPNIQLAFWSFSYDATPGANYDAPFNGFVSSFGQNASFTNNLNAVNSGGVTDYEQGFGYNNGVQNPFIAGVMNQTDILVFMTDGLPNTPGNGADNNTTARNAARAAVLKWRQAKPGTVIFGGLVQNAAGNQSQSGINYAINGSDTNAANTFQVSSDYSDLTRKLSSVIGTQCDLLNPPANYTLTPAVSTSGSVISGTDTAQFNYSVANASQTDSSTPTNWTVKRVLVNRGQAANKLYDNTGPFADGSEDGYSCAKLLTLINGQGSCQDVSSGSLAFGPRTTSMNNIVGPAAFISSDDSWQAGTKVCYVLTVAQPTQNASPVDRYSRAACVIEGKVPLVHITGGDLRVGRRFATDNTPQGNNAELSSVMGTVTPKLNGRTYGSWAEYGVFAPGVVVGFGSLSGMQGGALSNAQEFWSKLTFSNIEDPYGNFSPDETGQGTIPDVKTALLAGRPIARNLASTGTIDLNGDVTTGLYQKGAVGQDLGGLTINTSTIQPGKTIIIYVPANTVTIAGDINYSDGPYKNLTDIPQLIIIAKSISIASNVGNVDAWLIADDPTAGTVSTCNDPATLTTQVCSKLLRINGAVMAQHLDLRRTGGAGPGGDADTAAEVINLPADAYLWSQSEGQSDVRAQTTFTTELPPYF